MNGVTIIEEHIFRELDAVSVFIATGIIFLTIITILTVNLVVFKTRSTIVKIITIIVSIILTMFFMVVSITVLIDSYNTTYVEYIVTIDDNVGFNEFNSKYEIINVNGNEYRVREKE